jgi:hypothetical protein
MVTARFKFTWEQDWAEDAGGEPVVLDGDFGMPAVQDDAVVNAKWLCTRAVYPLTFLGGSEQVAALVDSDAGLKAIQQWMGDGSDHQLWAVENYTSARLTGDDGHVFIRQRGTGVLIVHLAV